MRSRVAHANLTVMTLNFVQISNLSSDARKGCTLKMLRVPRQVRQIVSSLVWICMNSTLHVAGESTVRETRRCDGSGGGTAALQAPHSPSPCPFKTHGPRQCNRIHFGSNIQILHWLTVPGSPQFSLQSFPIKLKGDIKDAKPCKASDGWHLARLGPIMPAL